MSNWTPTMVEERMAEAASILDRLPEERLQGYCSAWPEVVRNVHEAFGWHDPVMMRPWPSPGAIDRMDETLTWLKWLEPDIAKIVWMRATGARWKQICWAVGLQRSAAHQRYLFGHCVIARRLSGRRVPRNRSRQSVIDMVRAAQV